jgi:hypothetical protein
MCATAVGFWLGVAKFQSFRRVHRKAWYEKEDPSYSDSLVVMGFKYKLSEVYSDVKKKVRAKTKRQPAVSV